MQTRTGLRRRYLEPCQSDVTILTTVADLIDMAMGSNTENQINFKMLQAILHIFARQLRMMETHVDIQVAEEPIKRKKHKPLLSSSVDDKKKSKRPKSSDKVEKIYQKEQEENMDNVERRKYFKEEKAMLAKMDEKARDKYIKEEEEESRERHKRIIANMDENDKAMFAKLDDKERLKYLLQKDSKDREQAKLTKIRESERGLHLKEKEKPRTRRKRDENEEYYETDETDERDDEREKLILATMDEKQRAKFFKMDGKTKKNYLKEKEEEIEKAMIAKMDENEKEKFTKMNKKERAKYLSEKKKEGRDEKPDRDKENEDIIAKMEDEERNRFAEMDENGKNIYLKQKRKERKEMLPNMDDINETEKREILARMDDTEKERFAKMDKKGKEKYLKEKGAERKEAILVKMDEKEKEKYAKMDEKDKKKYISSKAKEIREMETKYDRKEELLAKMDEKEKEKYEKMDEKDKKKYISSKTKENREMETKYDRKEELLAKMDEKEKENYEKMDENDKKKYISSKAKEIREMETKHDRKEELLAKMDEKEKEKYEKMDENDKKKYISSKAKEIREMETKYDRKEELLAKMDEKEKEKYKKMNEKDKKKYISSKEKEIREMETKYDRKDELLAKMDEKEKEKYEKMDEKDKKKYISSKAKENREVETKYDRKEELLAKMDEKEKAKFAKMDETGKNKYLKEKEQQRKEALLAKMDKKEQEKYAKLDDIGKVKYLEEKYREESMNEREKVEYEKRGKNKEKDERKGTKLDKMDEKEKERGREKSILAKMTKKEQEKYAKMDGKDKENYLNKKEREEREKTILAEMDQSERSKFAKMNEKEKEKYLYQKQREKEMIENMDAKEKMQFSKMDEKGKENYLIEKEKKETENKKAAKEKARKDTRTRVGSIEVVTVSEFDLLKAEVEELQNKSAPIPFPTMPDNQKLRMDIASGSASLTDTMQAMQLSARVEAAETAISQMADILTALAASGTIPGDLADMGYAMGAPGEESVDDLRKTAGGCDKLKTGRSLGEASEGHNVHYGQDRRNYGGGGGVGGGAFRKDWASSSSESIMGFRGGIVKGPAAGQPKEPPPAKVINPVSRIELDNALRGIRADLTNNTTSIATKTQKIAESAYFTANCVAEKLEVLSELKPRIEEIHGLVNDYASQLAGFDAGVASQMKMFNEQMRHMRFDMDDGLNQMLHSTGNSETEAVKDLHVRFEDLVVSLDVTAHMHTELNTIHNNLKMEMRTVLDRLEALRDDKIDRDEVLDALHDKANTLCLDGLLTEKNFRDVVEYLENKLSRSYGKFVKQDSMWMKTLSDLSVNLSVKSDLIQVETVKKDTEEQLKKIQQDLLLLAKALGDPKAALLTRQLSVGTNCGPCRLPALQETTEVSSGQPLALPPLRRVKPEIKPEVKACEALIKNAQSSQDVSAHVCHRWVGGSHTLVTDSVVRRQAAPLMQAGGGAPTKTYVAPGADGRMYMMEGLLDVCMQCNKFQNPIDLGVDGTGDSVKKSNLLLNNNKDQ